DGEVDHKLPFGAGSTKIEFAAARDHVIENGVERKLVLARPSRDLLPDLRAVPPDEDRGRLCPSMSWIGGEKPREVAVIRLRWREGVERLLFLVVLAKRLAEFGQRLDTFLCQNRRRLPRNLGHEFFDIFELLQRRPAGI